jgi:hypothetical protein
MVGVMLGQVNESDGIDGGSRAWSLIISITRIDPGGLVLMRAVKGKPPKIGRPLIANLSLCSSYFRVTSRASELLTVVEKSARFFAASTIAWWLP